ncbi:MAG: hypothetical protein AB8B96_09390 [Lysobacterales bacterium]
MSKIRILLFYLWGLTLLVGVALPNGKGFTGFKLLLWALVFFLALIWAVMSVRQWQQTRAQAAANERRFLAQMVAMRQSTKAPRIEAD